MSTPIGNIFAPFKPITSLPDVNLYIKRSEKYIRLDSPDIEDSHIHNQYEMYVNISGNVSFLYNSNVYKIEPGDIIFSAPGDIHHCIFHSSVIHSHYCMWFSLPENSNVVEYIKSKNLCGFIRLSPAGKKKIFNLLAKIAESDNSHIFERSLCFFNLIEELSTQKISAPTSDKSLPRQLTDILEYMEKNFSSIHTVEELADTFYISITTLNRYFREYIKLSPHKFLTAKRLAHSEKLLREGCSVTDACFLSGFRDCSAFIEQFKKRYGVTPLKYKKGKF